MFLDGAVSRGRKCRDSLSRPDKRERASHFHFSFVSDAHPMHEAFEHRADFAFFHPRPNVIAHMLHGECGQLICQAHALNFLSRLDGARFVQQRRGIDHFTGDLAKRIEEDLRCRGRFAYHAVGRLRTHIEFNADPSRQAVLVQDTDGQIKRSKLWWS